VAKDLSGAASESWDALVIGAGPAGSVSASVLAGLGVRTLLVDRASFPRAKVCGGCLASAGVATLGALGLGGVLRGAGRVETLCVVARGASLRVPIEPSTMVERSAFDAALVGCAVERGAVFLPGVSARVLPDDSVELGGDGERRLVRPGLIVAADGLAGSSLGARPELAWRVDRRSPVGVGVALGQRPGHAGEGEITMVCGRAGYVGAAMVRDGLWTLACALRPGAVRSLGPLGAIRSVFDESGLEAPRVDRGALRGVGNLTRRRRAASGRVLTVGDAGGYVEPFTGEGMSWAVACAGAIGEFAEAALAGRDVSRGWGARCAEITARRRLVCRAVCGLAARPTALAAVLRAASGLGVAGWASRRLCWRGA